MQKTIWHSSTKWLTPVTLNEAKYLRPKTESWGRSRGRGQKQKAEIETEVERHNYKRDNDIEVL